MFDIDKSKKSIEPMNKADTMKNSFYYKDYSDKIIHTTDAVLQMKSKLVSKRSVKGLYESNQLIQRKTENKTGLPDILKSNVEAHSGLSMDDVKVHYNSQKPAGLQALAYTKGSEIFVGPGQEQHLGHEAWHVVQQKKGRVLANTNVGGQPVNDNASLEKEADEFSAKALGSIVQRKSDENQNVIQSRRKSINSAHPVNNIIQRMSITALAPNRDPQLNPVPGRQGNIPELYFVNTVVPQEEREGKSTADLASVYIAPKVAEVGMKVRELLKRNKTWHPGIDIQNNQLLNEFDVMYQCPDLGIYQEVEYNKRANGYGLHAIIKNTESYAREILNHAPNYRDRATYVQQGNIQPPLVGEIEDGQFPANHGLASQTTIADALTASSGDASSIAIIEAARFKFLRGKIGSLKMGTYLIFGKKAITIGGICSNFHNIIKANHFDRTVGWEKYSLTANHVYAWLLGSGRNDGINVTAIPQGNSHRTINRRDNTIDDPEV